VEVVLVLEPLDGFRIVVKTVEIRLAKLDVSGEGRAD
jgi:hypothetical protein